MIASLLVALCLDPALAGERPAEVEAVVDRAEAAGLPTAQLELKAAEGLAKGVPAERVAAVLGALEEHLRTADGLVPGEQPDRAAVVEAVALALHAGASQAATRRVLQASPDDRALLALADLVKLGVPEATAVQLVETAARSKQPSALAGVATATARLVASGVDPGHAGLQVADAVRAGQSPLSVVPSTHGRPDLPPDVPSGRPRGGRS